MGRGWSATRPAHRIKRRKVSRTYAEHRGVSSDGLECCREVLQGLGEGRVLRPGERGEPEAAADHEMGFAPELALPPDHGTPGHLRGEA